MKWPETPLGQVAEVAAGGGAPQDPADFSEEGFPFVRAGSLKTLVASESAKIDEHLIPEVAAKHGLRLFPAGTVVFAKSGMSASIGLVHRLRWPAYVVNHLAALICKEPLDSGYLQHYLKAFPPSHLIKDAAYPSIRLSDISAWKVPLPPCDEQRRIATILDKADALRTKRREAQAQLARLAQSIFVEMFGDPDEQIRQGRTAALSEVVATGKAVTYGIVQAGPEIPNGVPYIKTGDIKGGRILEGKLSRTSFEIASAYARSSVSAGDIVISIRATVGTTALVPPSLDGANLTQGTARISPGDHVRSMYLLCYLRTEAVQRWVQARVKGATFREITLGSLRNLPVYVPPLALQDQFEARIAAVGVLNSRYSESALVADKLFLSLQHRAFTGVL